VKVALLVNLVRPYPGIVSEYVAMQLGGRLLDFVVIVLCLFGLTRSRAIKLPTAHGRPILFFTSALCLQSFALLLHGVLVYAYPISVRDFSEPFRYLLMLIVLLAVYNDASLSDLKFLKRFWIGAVLFFGLIVCIRVGKIPLLYQVTDVLFGASKDKFVAEKLILRQTGFLVNPNWAGVFLSWALAFLLFNLEERKFMSMILLSLTMVLIVTTGSRTGLVCGVSVFLFWLVTRGRFYHWVVLIVALIVLVGGCFVFFDFQDFLAIFPKHHRELIRVVTETGSLANVSSLSLRVDIWKKALDLHFYSAPLLGHGPFKESVVDVVDNQYVKWVLWYGIWGVIVLVGYHGYYGVVALKTVFKCANSVEGNFAMSVLGMLISLSLAGVTGAFFDVTQLAFILFMSFGVLLVLSERQGNGKLSKVQLDGRGGQLVLSRS